MSVAVLPMLFSAGPYPMMCPNPIVPTIAIPNAIGTCRNSRMNKATKPIATASIGQPASSPDLGVAPCR